MEMSAAFFAFFSLEYPFFWAFFLSFNYSDFLRIILDGNSGHFVKNRAKKGFEAALIYKISHF